MDYKKCVYADNGWTGITQCDLLDRQCLKQINDDYNCGDYEDGTIEE